MINTRRNVRLTLACGVGIALFLALAGALFLPAIGLAALGIIGVVLTAAVMMARGTSRWGYVWAAAIAGVLWIGALIAYWALWASAFNFADSNTAIPASVQAGSNVALVAELCAFAGLIGAAVIMFARSEKFPTTVVAPSD